jgi:hypothetical protein
VSKMAINRYFMNSMMVGRIKSICVSFLEAWEG